MNKILKYLSEVRTELSRVTWPTRKQATKMTVVVLVASAIVGLYIGALDYGFTNLLGVLLK